MLLSLVKMYDLIVISFSATVHRWNKDYHFREPVSQETVTVTLSDSYVGLAELRHLFIRCCGKSTTQTSSSSTRSVLRDIASLRRTEVVWTSLQKAHLSQRNYDVDTYVKSLVAMSLFFVDERCRIRVICYPNTRSGSLWGALVLADKYLMEIVPLSLDVTLPTFAQYISKPKPVIKSLCSRHIIRLKYSYII